MLTEDCGQWRISLGDARDSDSAVWCFVLIIASGAIVGDGHFSLDFVLCFRKSKDCEGLVLAMRPCGEMIDLWINTTCRELNI